MAPEQVKHLLELSRGNFPFPHLLMTADYNYRPLGLLTNTAFRFPAQKTLVTPTRSNGFRCLVASIVRVQQHGVPTPTPVSSSSRPQKRLFPGTGEHPSEDTTPHSLPSTPLRAPATRHRVPRLY